MSTWATTISPGRPRGTRASSPFSTSTSPSGRSPSQRGGDDAEQLPDPDHAHLLVVADHRDERARRLVRLEAPVDRLILDAQDPLGRLGEASRSALR